MFLSEILVLLVMKDSVHLNRRAFVMAGKDGAIYLALLVCSLCTVCHDFVLPLGRHWKDVICNCGYSLTHCSLDTPKRVISKQCRPRSDAAE